MSTTDSRPDHDSSPLLGLGSSAGLGPLPEPDGWAVRETYYPEQTTGLGAVRFGGRGFERYTADQLRAAVAAERERWTEAVMAELDGNGQAHAIVAYATRA